VYQVGDVYARSCVVIGTTLPISYLVRIGSQNRTLKNAPLVNAVREYSALPTRYPSPPSRIDFKEKSFS